MYGIHATFMNPMPTKIHFLIFTLFNFSVLGFNSAFVIEGS